MFYFIFNLTMALIMFLLGICFYKSNGKAAEFLTGYNSRSKEERKNYDEKTMCEAYGRRIMFMAFPFIVGTIIDFFYQGIGCLIAWAIWCVMFVLLLINRHMTEH